MRLLNMENSLMKKKIVFKGLKTLGKITMVVLQALIAFASEDKKPRLAAGKAEQLYEDGVISGIEFSKHIHGD